MSDSADRLMLLERAKLHPDSQREVETPWLLLLPGGVSEGFDSEDDAVRRFNAVRDERSAARKDEQILAALNAAQLAIDEYHSGDRGWAEAWLLKSYLANKEP